MSNYGNPKFYDTARKDLIDWVWNNKKLLHKISRHNLQYLFEFHPQRGLSVDLRRFEPEYYNEVFYPPELKKANIDEFIRKVCVVLQACLKKANRPDVSLTITVRHMVSETSLWKTFYIDQRANSGQSGTLSTKEQDWYYSLRQPNEQQKNG